MPTLKKYNTFEELKSDYVKEDISEEEIKKRHDQLQEFAELLNKNKTTKTNSLTSHHPERNTRRADKMSGYEKSFKKLLQGKSKKFDKRFASKKRRTFLKSETE